MSDCVTMRIQSLTLKDTTRDAVVAAIKLRIWPGAVLKTESKRHWVYKDNASNAMWNTPGEWPNTTPEADCVQLLESNRTVTVELDDIANPIDNLSFAIYLLSIFAAYKATSDWAIRELPLPNAFIQWKGTDVCADYHCLCGEQFHVDAEFAYAVQCPHCERRYEVSSVIELREIPSDEAWDGCPILRGSVDEE